MVEELKGLKKLTIPAITAITKKYIARTNLNVRGAGVEVRKPKNTAAFASAIGPGGAVVMTTQLSETGEAILKNTRSKKKKN